MNSSPHLNIILQKRTLLHSMQATALIHRLRHLIQHILLHIFRDVSLPLHTASYIVYMRLSIGSMQG